MHRIFKEKKTQVARIACISFSIVVETFLNRCVPRTFEFE